MTVRLSVLRCGRDLVGSQTRDLPARSVVPQATTLPRATLINILLNNNYSHKSSLYRLLTNRHKNCPDSIVSCKVTIRKSWEVLSIGLMLDRQKYRRRRVLAEENLLASVFDLKQTQRSRYVFWLFSVGCQENRSCWYDVEVRALQNYSRTWPFASKLWGNNSML
jgi:hypothetical protein